MRSKIAVHSTNPSVDPVGACVGPKGMRVRTIVDELRGEKIDIVKYSEDPEEYVANALSPSKVVSARADKDEKICRVVVPDYQLSLPSARKGRTPVWPPNSPAGRSISRANPRRRLPKLPRLRKPLRKVVRTHESEEDSPADLHRLRGNPQ